MNLFSLEVEHVDCHLSACLTQTKRGFDFLTRIFGNTGMTTLPWLSFNVRNKRGIFVREFKHNQFPEELEVDEPIPQSLFSYGAFVLCFT